MGRAREPSTRYAAGVADEYWDWVAVALFLLVSVDLLTTLFAAARYGTAAEANPLVGWLLAQPLAVLVGANLLVVVLAVAFFYGVAETLARTPAPFSRYYAAGVEAFLGSLVAAGLFVYANNLAVVVHGASLL
jgi:hypothetical protein